MDRQQTLEETRVAADELGMHDVTDAEFSSSSTALVRSEPTSMLVRPVAPPNEIAAAIDAFEETKRLILKPSDFQSTGDGSFVKRAGWSKLAVAFGVSSRFKEGYPVVIRDEDGQPVRAEAIVIAVAPNGRSAEGFGACSITEPRFTTQNRARKRSEQRPGPCNGDDKTCPIHYAHGGAPIESARQKLEHDLPSTAETRARNRAYSNLFGNGELSAEEVDAYGGEVIESPAQERASYSGGSGDDGSDQDSYRSDFPKASPNKPASSNQLATIAKLSRLLGEPEEPDENMTSAEASDRITVLSREYNERKGVSGRRRAG